MSRVGQEILIRAVIVADQGERVQCLPVDADHLAFDGAGFMPGHLVVDKRALVQPALQRQVEPCPVMYGGEIFNRKPTRRKRKATR